MTRAWRSLLAGPILLFGLLLAPLASASKEDPVCAPYDGKPAYEKRVCQSAVLTELERKYSALADELGSGWHLDFQPTDEEWRTGLAACSDDACLETAYRKRLLALDALPAFPCGDGLNPAEQAVCRTPALGRLDRKLNLAYDMALDASYTLLALRADQRRWRVQVRDACRASLPCLGRVYRARVLVLQRDLARTLRHPSREGPQVSDQGHPLLKTLKFSPAQTRSIQAQIAAATQAQQADADACVRKPVELLDLNRDGHPEPVFMTCGGAHNELAFFFLWGRGQTGKGQTTEGQYRLVLTDWVGYFGYQVQDTRSHGLPVLRLITHGSCCDHGSAYYAFDGQRYRAVACYDERFLRDDFYVFEDLGKPEGDLCF